jgi:heme exporter protein C
LGQTSRNVFYHVPMWFAMMAMAYTSVAYSVAYLRKGDLAMDLRAREAGRLTVVFGALGLATGIVWSRVTWGEAMPATDPAAWWPWDPKQTSALICVLIYLGMALLRMSFDEPVQRAKISSVFNIFAAASIYPLFYVVPKSLESLHPNTGGKQSALGSMSPEFYSVFWPAVIGFVCLSYAMLDLLARRAVVHHQLQELSDE